MQKYQCKLGWVPVGTICWTYDSNTFGIDYGSTRFDLGYASAIATVLFLLMMGGANLLVRSFLRKLGE